MATRFPDPPAGVPATPLDVIDQKLERLSSRKEAWLRVSVQERVRLLRRIEARLDDVALPWGMACARAGGFLPSENGAGEGLIASAVITARGLRQTREALERGARPKVSTKVRRNGQVVAKVLPSGLTDALLFARITAEVWLEPGADPTQGRIYRENHPDPARVCLVLGAGNIPSIAPTDVLYKLFVEDQVVVLKMNPVNEFGGPFLERLFQPLIDEGYLAVVYGGVEQGKYLTTHALVDALHITGSTNTYDAIVWGDTPEEQAANKAANKKRVDKPFTSELGNVTPILVVPGDWSASDMDTHARHVAAAVTHNASFDCVAGKVLVLADGWDRRDAFVSLVKEKLRALPSRKAYYPGAEARWQGFMSAYPTGEVLSAAADGVVPWTYFPDVEANKEQHALRHEAFCGVLAEVNLPATTSEEFLAKAVPFANDDVWGTLACLLLTDGATERRHAEALDKAIEELRYGCIGVNVWPGAIFGFMNPTWGAFPGHSDEDIRSGRGVVHNTALLDHPQKSVVRSPVRLPVTPPWFSDHKNLLDVGKGLLRLEASYSPLRLATILPALMKG